MQPPKATLLSALLQVLKVAQDFGKCTLIIQDCLRQKDGVFPSPLLAIPDNRQM